MTVDFKAKQSEFTSYIRDPKNNPRPLDVEKQRIDIYRELIFNNIESFLSNNFPVLKAILENPKWLELSQDFFVTHTCTTPYFSEIAEEFIDYLQNQRQNQSDFPFLLELAHYEWVEMALSISKDENTANSAIFLKNLFQEEISLSPLAWPLVYQFPVQQISPSFIPEITPSTPTYLLVYRNISDNVNFIQISPITYRLLQILQNNESMSCASCLKQIAEESAHPDPQKIIDAGFEIMQDLAEKNIIQIGIQSEAKLLS